LAISLYYLDRGKLGNLFPKISNTGLALNDTGYELLTQMLTLDPSRRITAGSALKHRWLSEEMPRPTPTERMPTFKSRHDTE
jgi:cell division cycle 2-like protein